MQAVLFPAPETLHVERVPDPTCAPDEVIVQVSRCGLCACTRFNYMYARTKLQNHQPQSQTIFNPKL